MNKNKQYQNFIDKYSKIYIPTNDDWHGNYPFNTVALIYIGELSDGTFRVLVTGNDDTGFEKDYKTENEAILMYERLKNYPIINYDDVIELGFRHK